MLQLRGTAKKKKRVAVFNFYLLQVVSIMKWHLQKCDSFCFILPSPSPLWPLSVFVINLFSLQIYHIQCQSKHSNMVMIGSALPRTLWLLNTFRIEATLLMALCNLKPIYSLRFCALNTGLSPGCPLHLHPSRSGRQTRTSPWALWCVCDNKYRHQE